MRALLAVVIACGLATASGQTAQPPQSPPSQTSDSPSDAPLDSTGNTAAQQPTVFTSRTTIVLIPALVTTNKGEPVFTLHAEDFTVTDDGAPQQIALEEDTGGEPLALVVAVETGGDGGRRLENYRNLPALIEAMVGSVEHQVAVVSFDSAPHFIQGFDPDLNKMRVSLDSLAAGNGGAAILDTLAFSVDLLRRQPARYRRAILLISETVDQGSTVKLNEAVRSISDTNTAIYGLAFTSSRAAIKHEASKVSSATPGPPGGCISRGTNEGPDRDPERDVYVDPDPDDSRLTRTWECLSVLAPPLRLIKMAALATMDGLRRNVPETVSQLTGGEYFHAENARSLERDMLTLANHLPNRYLLSFHPQSPRAGLHLLRVQLKEYPKLSLAARTSYWADEPQAQPRP